MKIKQMNPVDVLMLPTLYYTLLIPSEEGKPIEITKSSAGKLVQSWCLMLVKMKKSKTAIVLFKYTQKRASFQSISANNH